MGDRRRLIAPFRRSRRSVLVFDIVHSVQIGAEHGARCRRVEDGEPFRTLLRAANGTPASNPVTPVMKSRRLSGIPKAPINAPIPNTGPDETNGTA